jgi:hypothetical protein
MEYIVKLKHWQIFLVLGTVYILYLILSGINFTFGKITSHELSIMIGIITICLFFLWVLVIGLYLNSIPDNPYKFNKWILILSIFWCIIGYSELLLQRLENNNNIVPGWISFSITLLTFLSLYYTFYNVPKSLKSIELGRKSKFTDYIVTAILIFAFPIGIWFIQPRVNRIYNANKIFEN